MSSFLLQCQRIRKSKPFTEQLRLTYRDEHPDPLPLLTIESDYKPTLDAYRCTETYTIDEFPCSGEFDGRGFRLKKQSTGDTRDVFLHHNGQDMLCDCEGFTRFGYCKHCDCMRQVVRMQLLADPQAFPLDDFPVWPCPEGSDPFADEVTDPTAAFQGGC